MDKLRFIAWYGEHRDAMIGMFFAPIALSWYFYFEPTDQQWYTWGVVGIAVAVYFAVKKNFQKFCYDSILKGSSEFTKNPKISGATTEQLLDSYDNEILGTIDELREEKGDYLKIMASLVNLMEPEELMERLGKLRTLNLIRANLKRMTLTPAGLDAVNAPSSKATIPHIFASRLAKARLQLEEGDFGGSLDTVNILFEEILKSKIEEKYGLQIDNTWHELKRDGHVKRDFDKASLGELRHAAKQLGLIQESSLPYNILGSFLILRTSEKHSTGEKPDLEKNAKTALDFANAFLRHWFG